MARRRWRSYAVVALALAALLMGGALWAGAPVDEAAVAPAPAMSNAEVDVLLGRAEGLRTELQQAESYLELQVDPIDRILRRHTSDRDLARRIAVSLVREGNRSRLEPRMLLAVLLVENPWLDPRIRSSVGAVGLMQVMPVHGGQWGCGTDLEDVDVNICHGARIFAHDLERTGGNVEQALLRYNGCVNGTNTPDCHKYPDRVLAYAGDAGLMAWLQPRRLALAASK
jgi:soluble lytic murein transglycosylase-like protein